MNLDSLILMLTSIMKMFVASEYCSKNTDHQLITSPE